MKNTLLKVWRLFLGLFLYAVGIVLTINANVGLSPWDVFHQGLSKNLHITMGQAAIAMGFIIVIADSLLGERIGWGTLSNMLFVGIFMDILMLNNLIPVFQNIILRVIMMLSGMMVIGIATYLYIGSGFGSGPRDGLMIALTKRTGKSVRFIRNSIEITVLTLGYFLGGSLGLGTLAMVILIGYFVQFAFKLFKFDVKKVKHRFIDEDIKFIKELFIKPKKNKERLNVE